MTTDTGVLISAAERPILGTTIPWETASSYPGATVGGAILAVGTQS